MEVKLRELADDRDELLALLHLGDLGVEFEVSEDLAYVGRESLDVAAQVGRSVLGACEQLLKRPLARVVEGVPRLVAQDGVRRLGVLGELLHDLRLGGLKRALHAADDGHGDDDVLVLVGLVGAAQLVGDAEYGIDLRLDVYLLGHVGSGLP